LGSQVSHRNHPGHPEEENPEEEDSYRQARRLAREREAQKLKIKRAQRATVIFSSDPLFSSEDLQGPLRVEFLADCGASSFFPATEDLLKG
jgi:hypothetical protein